MHKLYAVGQTVRIGDTEGRILRITETFVVMECAEGSVAVPALSLLGYALDARALAERRVMSAEAQLLHAFVAQHPDEVSRLVEQLAPAMLAEVLGALHVEQAERSRVASYPSPPRSRWPS